MSYHKIKPNFLKVKTSFKDAKKGKSSSKDELISRLVKNVSPYNDRDFKIISSRAFLSPHIREIMSIWEEDPSSPLGITDASNEAINNLKYEYPNLQKWDYSKIMHRISNNWKDRDQIQADLNKEVFELAKSTDLKQREDMNPENEITINETKDNNKILNDMINEKSESLNWEKALPMTRYPNEAPPIILDNIDEVTDLNVCNSEIKLRDIPSTKDLSVLTSHYDNSTGKWLESRRASHPFISVKMTKIDPAKNNTDTSQTTMRL